MKKLIFIALLPLMLAACEPGGNKNEMERTDSSFDLCFMQNADMQNAGTQTDSLTFKYIDGTLHLSHVMWLNCAMTGCEVFSRVEATSIHIEEKITGDFSANCTCASRADFSLVLPAGLYTVTLSRTLGGVTLRTDVCTLDLDRSSVGSITFKDL